MHTIPATPERTDGGRGWLLRRSQFRPNEVRMTVSRAEFKYGSDFLPPQHCITARKTSTSPRPKYDVRE